LRAVADELAGEGIEIVSSTAYLPELLVEEGCFTKRKPGKEEMEDILFGWKVAKELGRLDIGQSVVVRQKTVLAVEAIDGTDATIRRGGRIAKEKAVVVKVSKPNQDLRFDVPSIGLETIEIMGEVKAAALAVEAGRTLIFDREKMLQKANEKKIAVIALSAESIK
ncbi:MAG TPA: LpxI family protein, partial [Deltaproteobacteria bacterium]|nr:LpxI family protein [Deltaproteobacteria bacterium]